MMLRGNIWLTPRTPKLKRKDRRFCSTAFITSPSFHIDQHPVQARASDDLAGLHRKMVAIAPNVAISPKRSEPLHLTTVIFAAAKIPSRTITARSRGTLSRTALLRALPTCLLREGKRLARMDLLPREKKIEQQVLRCCCRELNIVSFADSNGKLRLGRLQPLRRQISTVLRNYSPLH